MIRWLGALLLAAAAVVPVVQRPREEPPRDDIELGETLKSGQPLPVDRLLALWSDRLGVEIVSDLADFLTTNPPMFAPSQLEIRFSEPVPHLTWGLFNRILEFHGIALEQRTRLRRTILRAHHRLLVEATSWNIEPCTIFLLPPMPPPLVTAVLKIEHGAGNEIFATIRGLVTRDVDRARNILYVRGPELIVVVDSASNVSYFTKIVHMLDVRTPGMVTRLVRLSFAPAEKVARALRSLPGLASASIAEDTATNKLILQAFPFQFEEITRTIADLDVGPTADDGRGPRRVR